MRFLPVTVFTVLSGSLLYADFRPGYRIDF